MSEGRRCDEGGGTAREEEGVEVEEYVEVTKTYSYQKEGRAIHMIKGEILYLLKRYDEWWQVIRQREKKSFFAPANILRLLTQEEVAQHIKTLTLQQETKQQPHQQPPQQQPPQQHPQTTQKQTLQSLQQQTQPQQQHSHATKQQQQHLLTAQQQHKQPQPQQQHLLTAQQQKKQPQQQHLQTAQHQQKQPQQQQPQPQHLLTAQQQQKQPQQQHLQTVQHQQKQPQQQHHSQTAQHKPPSNDIFPLRRPQALSLGVGEGRTDLPSPNTQAYMAKIEPTRVLTERKDAYPGRPPGFSSFKGDVVKPHPHRSGSGESPSSVGNLQSTQTFQESSSSHTSKSSLNDGSAESLKHIQFRKHVMKSSSHDELTRGVRSQSSLDVSQPKAASSEELDGRRNIQDDVSNQLALRHRSNSVDFRYFQKELTFSEMKQGSLDKPRKPRITKDPGNRRRSWAVEGRTDGGDCFRPPSLKRGETVDAAIILDVPPKLPPKLKKNKMDAFKFSSENISKLEGPIDLKLQEVKRSSRSLQQETSSLPYSKDDDRRHSRHGSDPLLLSETERRNTSRDNFWVTKDYPIARPRKFLPPQVTALDSRKLDRDPHFALRHEVSLPGNYGEVMSRDANGNQVKKSSSHSSLNISTPIREESLLKRGGSMSQGNQKYKVHPENVNKPHGNYKKGLESTPESQRRATSDTQTNQRTPETTRKSSVLRDTWQSFKSKGRRKENEQQQRREEEKENENARIPLRETPTPDSSRGGKMMPTPPSPQTPPQRLVLEDWGEYIDEASGRPYYFNPTTREKRWKPPRKGIHSVSIPEVPQSAKACETLASVSRVPPRSPVPDYPNSPKSSHKPFSYSHPSEAPSGTSRGSTFTSAYPSPHSQVPVSPPTLPITHNPTMSPSTGTANILTHHPTSSAHVVPPPVVPPMHSHPSLSSSNTLPTSSIPPTTIPGLPLVSHHTLPANTGTPGKGVPPPQQTSPLNLNQYAPPQQTSPLNPNHQSPIQYAKQIPQAGPPAPPSSAKPTLPTTPTSPDFPHLDKNLALLDVLYNVPLPKGWEKRYDAYTQRVYFFNKALKERWLATVNDEGKIYYYEESGAKSQWILPQVQPQAEDHDDPDNRWDSLTRPSESVRISQIAEHLPELTENIKRDGFLHRTFLVREGKKVRKNWTQSYARFIVREFDTGSTGLIYFSKSRDEDKKAEVFEFYPPCQLEQASDKKTSRQLVLGLRNSHETEILLQFDDRDIANEWHKALENHEGVSFVIPEKKGKRGGSDKLKRESSMEQLNPDSLGITDKLRNFIKRRPLKETLEKKGIYKESVFGSTLSELHIQDKTTIPIFVLQCINHIEKSEENLRSDGLYRISGNAAQIQKIRFEVAQRNYTILSQEKEIHNLSGSLKLFFRELKEPLVPYAVYDDFIQATGSEFRRKNQQADKLQAAIKKLPVENYDTLMILLQHLLRVSEYESENRMSISNLAIVFGPCLLWPQDTNAHDLMTDVMLHNRVIEGLLSDYHAIFTAKR